MFNRIDDQAFDYVVAKMDVTLNDNTAGIDYSPVFIRLQDRVASVRTVEDNTEIRAFAKDLLKTAINEDEINELEKEFLNDIVNTFL